MASPLRSLLIHFHPDVIPQDPVNIASHLGAAQLALDIHEHSLGIPFQRIPVASASGGK